MTARAPEIPRIVESRLRGNDGEASGMNGEVGSRGSGIYPSGLATSHAGVASSARL